MGRISYLDHLRQLAGIDRAVRRREYPNASSLARELGCHARTVHRYIRWLRRELKAPLAFDPRTNGFYYDARFDFGKELLKWLEK